MHNNIHTSSNTHNLHNNNNVHNNINTSSNKHNMHNTNNINTSSNTQHRHTGTDCHRVGKKTCAHASV